MRAIIFLSALAFFMPGAAIAKSGHAVGTGTTIEADLSAAKKAAKNKKKATAKVKKKPKVEYLKAAPRY